MWFTGIVLVSVLIVALSFYYIRWREGSERRRFAKKIGGPLGVPLFGNALEILKNLNRTLHTVCNWIDKYGERFVFSLGPVVGFVTNDAKDLETILSSTNIIGKSQEYELVNAWLGDGLITSTGSHWAHRRKLITPTFHFSILETFIGPINEHAKIMLDTLRTNFITKEKENEFKDIQPFLARCALDIICETAMGKKINSQLEGNSEYVQAINDMGKLFQYRSIRPWLINNWTWGLTAAGRHEAKCLNIIHSFTDNVIAERKQYMESSSSPQMGMETGKGRLAFLDLLLQAQYTGANISDKGIREETTTFMFAGHDTVSVALGFCLFNIGNHPEVQEKLHRELDVIFQGNTSRQISSADIREMKYLECCIKESLRLHPSVPIIARRTNQDFKLDDETIIPTGVAVFYAPYKLHRNSKYFPKPEEFIPERFALGSCMANKNPWAYIPFSAGPRNCIGQKFAMMEIKILLASIFREFKVQSEKKAQELDLLSEIVLRSRDGIVLRLEKR